MRKHLYLYLFIFASLIALVFYINGRKYQEKLEQQVAELREDIEENKQQSGSTESSLPTTGVEHPFTLAFNPEAEEYLYDMDLTTQEVEQQVMDKLLELNLNEGGNPLIPYTGAGRGFQISNSFLVNHKWVLVNFYDGDQWGEAMIQYDIDADKNVELSTIKALLYLN
ncbi:hypothetical protein BST97_14245 [Nonlabens spongiae]|uniref:Hydrolase n=1 Tax=Nonlabens spongiae TaxID=331648 RepID=A0A1W6MN67_9FLAO|nr:hypothetical protein [Nonlabens spongiae]ARN79054.1 hypothetical protein BST97_14245 [Nonlabens spongiae]